MCEEDPARPRGSIVTRPDRGGGSSGNRSEDDDGDVVAPSKPPPSSFTEKGEVYGGVPEESLFPDKFDPSYRDHINFTLGRLLCAQR